MPDSTRDRLSKAPSWIMVGGVVGAILALAAKEQIDARNASRVALLSAANAVPTPTPTPRPPASKHHASLFEYEDIFQRWEEKAVWEHDLTQVAFWDPTTNKYTEYVEILRNGDEYYFRTLPRLTWPLVDVGIAPDQPLLFAEPEPMHAARHASDMIPFLR